MIRRKEKGQKGLGNGRARGRVSTSNDAVSEADRSIRLKAKYSFWSLMKQRRVQT